MPPALALTSALFRARGACGQGGTTLENVTLVASCAAPIFLTADTVTLPSLAGGNRTPTIVPFTFRTRAMELPTSLDAIIMATYNAPTGEPRCARCEVHLPMRLVAAPVPPIKQSAYKVTLDTNRPPPSLGTLFEDVLQSSPELYEAVNAGANALSIQVSIHQWVAIEPSKPHRAQEGAPK